ncbi:vinorine synthase-like [Melia azedarach]|uniref:Limonoid 21-O-acetyltransferse n=2 Tax=Melia azedarach TaxID=155640 RepID=L21AT_MELAZ|nr:vinorine synthase-like [Melia azedarach]WBW48722.1 L21AT [Melia azedarach]
MNLRITSSEIIKPSSPTPQNLKSYRLSIVDQLTPNVYFSIILLYTKTTENPTKTSDHLKKSLSETLTRYYPLAGQLKYDQLIVDCNDQGVPFVEADVSNHMSELLKLPNIDVLEQLLPFKPHEGFNAERSNVTVQVNYFGCGGMAIGLCFKHKVLDATTAAFFVKNWGVIARGAGEIKDVIYDQASLFPARDLSFLSKSVDEEFLKAESETKRFVFDGSAIASMREKFTHLGRRPTRFEVVSAVILGALISAAKESEEPPERLDTIISVNLRQRMVPPFPEHCLGNIISGGLIYWPLEKKLDHGSLAEEIHQSIKKVDDQFARKFYGEAEFLNLPRLGANEVVKKREFWVTSWCKTPLHQSDFGWGKPKWAGNSMRLNEITVLFDTSDGEGIEAWVGLPKKDMARFEQDATIVAYTSPNPTIL